MILLRYPPFPLQYFGLRCFDFSEIHSFFPVPLWIEMFWYYWYTPFSLWYWGLRCFDFIEIHTFFPVVLWIEMFWFYWYTPFSLRYWRLRCFDFIEIHNFSLRYCGLRCFDFIETHNFSLGYCGLRCFDFIEIHNFSLGYCGLRCFDFIDILLFPCGIEGWDVLILLRYTTFLCGTVDVLISLFPADCGLRCFDFIEIHTFFPVVLRAEMFWFYWDTQLFPCGTNDWDVLILLRYTPFSLRYWGRTGKTRWWLAPAPYWKSWDLPPEIGKTQTAGGKLDQAPVMSERGQVRVHIITS